MRNQIMKFISIHSLRMEGDLRHCPRNSTSNHFNPLPPHGGRHVILLSGTPTGGISIHSLRMEGDSGALSRSVHFHISIHSLRMEGDSNPQNVLHKAYQFQSTPSAWRETIAGGDTYVVIYLFQSTPSAWRETQSKTICETDFGNFNPLPPHGGRPAKQREKIRENRFQSTPSAWRETSISVYIIHLIVYFNPLPPHGGRLYNFDNVFCVELFQSTPSAWRETCLTSVEIPEGTISIHSLRMEGDFPCVVKVACWKIFQSTPSAWRETSGILSSIVPDVHFNPLPPHGGRLYHLHPLYANSLFQSTPSAWRETVRETS